MGSELRCKFCNSQVERLSEAEALEDMIGHGWSNCQTAQVIACYDCFVKGTKSSGRPSSLIPYETYTAGRIVRKRNGEIWVGSNSLGWELKGKWK